ncbi:hypothetical protein CDD80_647 [Ophiocordyceps camponoti-rufipedis]|uniref:mRNA export factor GLE1 n=1 Tax=Ophiocordyceps camponoti-rufipedis TaxID=2004952 RepID=A0A2C5ZCF5_9HYPO|nr:hypothetical protein CDD80_647 [Ophiocordyceps camponoti-rufipedis]
MTRPSPDRTPSSFLSVERNSASNHRDALEAAQAEHDRVREDALRVYELHELKEEHQRILDRERREQLRLKAEAEVAAEEKRLQELRAKSIPKPQPLPVPAPVQQPAATQEPAVEARRQEKTADNHVGATSSSVFGAPQKNGQQTKPESSSAVASAAQPVLANGAAPAIKPAAPVIKPEGTPLFKPAAIPAQPAKEKAPPSTPKATVDRLLQIHGELKVLRTDLMAQSKLAGSPLKGKLGALRREIRVAVGQLTTGKGANTLPTRKIVDLLQEAVEGKIAGPLVDVNRFVAEPRVSQDGSDDAKLPALFIYLINVCAKGIINQFINECGANPKAADPIGVFTAQLFSHKDFQWRGKSLIDILLAKFRVVCPVLFGLRGSDKTERGRLALGWKKDGPGWITEQSHNDRMAGLGAGFAAVSLRDFSKSSRQNPYPPKHYWMALAHIVNTPPSETSNTQCIVLRALIDGHEGRFLDFYGNAAVAALRLALIDFPTKAPENAPAAGSLRALTEVLRSEKGLVLS